MIALNDHTAARYPPHTIQSFKSPEAERSFRREDVRSEIVHGTRRVTADTALRLGRYFGISPQFWLNLQGHFDLEQEQDRLGGRLEQEVQALALA